MYNKLVIYIYILFTFVDVWNSKFDFCFKLIYWLVFLPILVAGNFYNNMNMPLQCSITEMKSDIRLKNKPKVANYEVQTSNP